MYLVLTSFASQYVGKHVQKYLGTEDPYYEMVC